MIDQTKRLRRSEISIFCAFMTLVLAGLSLYGMVDDSALVPVMIKHPDMALLWYAVEGSGLLAAFAIAVGGLPIAWASARRIWLRARGEMWLLLVPVISAILVAAPPLAAISTSLAAPTTQAVPGTNQWIVLVYAAVVILAAASSTAAVCVAIARTEGEEIVLRAPGIELTVQPYRFAVLPTAVASLAMLLMLAATVLWGLAATSYDSANWGANRFEWELIVAVMGIAALVSVASVVRVLRTKD